MMSRFKRPFAVPSRVKKREIVGWAMYDFANSSYTTVVITFIYSAFFVSAIVPEELAHLRNTFWAAAIAISTLISIVGAPLLGILCDLTGHKKRYLGYFTAASVLGTGGLYFVDPGNILLGMCFLILSNTAWMLSESFNASFLTDLASDKNMGKVSGFGWGIGYIGGLLSLILVSLILKSSANEYPDLYVHEHQTAMVLIALFYAVGALPMFLFVKERSKPKAGYESVSAQQLIKAAFDRCVAIKALIRQYPVLFRFFIAFLIYSAGISVVVKFLGIFAQEDVGITGTTLIFVGATLQISSMAGAIGFGVLEDRIGSKASILYSILLWISGIIAMYFLQPISSWLGTSTVNGFLIIAFIAGSAMGATQSSSRAMVGHLAKPEDSALLFGLWGTFARLSIVLAMLFGPVSDLVGRKNALLLILVYFVAGGLALIKVPVNTHVREERAHKN